MSILKKLKLKLQLKIHCLSSRNPTVLVLVEYCSKVQIQNLIFSFLSCIVLRDSSTCFIYLLWINIPIKKGRNGGLERRGETQARLRPNRQTFSPVAHVRDLEHRVVYELQRSRQIHLYGPAR